MGRADHVAPFHDDSFGGNAQFATYAKGCRHSIQIVAGFRGDVTPHGQQPFFDVHTLTTGRTLMLDARELH